MYDLTSVNATNTNTLLDVFTVVGTQSGNIFGLLILITVFIGFYLAFNKEGNINDLLISSFITAILGTLLLLAGVVAWAVYIGCLFIFIAVFIIKWYMT